MKSLILAITLTAASSAIAGADVDANHPDLSDPLSKDNYEQNPALYTKGWKDGWQWASALPDKSQTYSSQCEKICRKKYGNIDKDGSKAETESFGFMSAAAYVRNHQNGDSDSTDITKTDSAAGPMPDASGWDGCPGGWRTKDAVKQILNDPDSFRFDGARSPALTTHNGQSCWRVTIQFRAKNAFAGYIRGVADVDITGGETVTILETQLRD
jgi:hypothetical protein